MVVVVGPLRWRAVAVPLVPIFPSSTGQVELRAAAGFVDKMGTGNVNFADFLALMAKRVADSESPAACVAAFKVRFAAPLSFVCVCCPSWVQLPQWRLLLRMPHTTHACLIVDSSVL